MKRLVNGVVYLLYCLTVLPVKVLTRAVATPRCALCLDHPPMPHETICCDCAKAQAARV